MTTRKSLYALSVPFNSSIMVCKVIVTVKSPSFFTLVIFCASIDSKKKKKEKNMLSCHKIRLHGEFNEIDLAN